MVFSSIVFLFLFLPAVFIAYFNPLVKSIAVKNTVLLLFSLIFYSWLEPSFLLIMLFSILMNYFSALALERYETKAKFIFWISIFFNLGILFVFKYLNFSLRNLEMLFDSSLPTFKIILPIGISFFTFQAMSYVIDVYRKKIKAQRNLVSLGLYIAFFPQLVAGPILRYKDVALELETRKENFDDFADGSVRFIEGLAKKVILANNLAWVSNRAFSLSTNELSIGFAWFGATVFLMQLYFDFSGYSDMAIGMGKMFGFHFPENFNHPYTACSIAEFWRRWHISLGSWFKDYVFMSLKKSRQYPRLFHIRNLVIVWFLIGLWHGANWTFVVWGMLTCIFLIIEQLTKISKKLGWFGHIYMYFFGVITSTLFRSDNLHSAWLYFKALAGFGSADAFAHEHFMLYFDNYKYFFFAGLILVYLSKSYISKIRIDGKLAKFGYVFFKMSLLLLSLGYIIQDLYNPFIYFNF